MIAGVALAFLGSLLISSCATPYGRIKGGFAPAPKKTCDYEVLVTVDPDRSSIAGNGTFRFTFPTSNKRIPLGLDPLFMHTHSDIDGFWQPRGPKRNPYLNAQWNGWPETSRPERTLLTHISQDHLVMGPLFLWYPAIIDTNTTGSGTLTISCPERFQVAIDGDIVSQDVRQGFRKTEVSFGGLNPRPLLCAVSRYPLQEFAWNEKAIRLLVNPIHQIDGGRLSSVIVETLEALESLLGPYPHRMLTLVEAPQVLKEDFIMSQDVLGIAFHGLILFPADKLEGEIDRELLAHELAHQWWGTSVGRNRTPGMGGAWLVEGVAQYATLHCLVAAGEGETKQARIAEWARTTRQMVSAAGDEALCELHPAKSKPERLYLAYNKGPYVLTMIERRLGEESWHAFLREMTAKWQGERPSVNCLEAELNAWTGKDWGPFFKTWVRGSGLPNLTIDYACTRQPDWTWQLTIRCRQEIEFELDLPVAVQTAEGPVDLVLGIADLENVSEHTLPGEPTALVVNPSYDVLLGEVEVTRVSAAEMP